jgi:hypothetical protein
MDSARNVERIVLRALAVLIDEIGLVCELENLVSADDGEMFVVQRQTHRVVEGAEKERAASFVSGK